MAGMHGSGTSESGVSGDATGPAPVSASVDPLLPWLATDTSWRAEIVEAIERDGYVLLPGVFSPSECAAEVGRLWELVEAVSGGAVRRGEPGTWYPTPGGAETDPWPHSGWRSFPDMFQSFGAGWLFSALREALAERVFEPLFGRRELHCSKEGFTFHRPTAGGEHPAAGRRPFVCGAPSQRSAGEHFDQPATQVGLHCLQSSTSLLDQTADPDAGCFMCWPGSHRLHSQLTSGTYRGRKEWVPLTDGELEQLEAAGLAPRRVRAAAGDVILWRSDLVHAAASPGPNAACFRAVAYACMLPVALHQGSLDSTATQDGDAAMHRNASPHATSATPRSLLSMDSGLVVCPLDWQSIPNGQRKLEAYLRTETGDHHPGAEFWLSPKPARAAAAPGDFFADGPPRLTWRQAELYGLVPYLPIEELRSISPLRRRELKHGAEARGIRFMPEWWPPSLAASSLPHPNHHARDGSSQH
mmetsp:Transcript_48393/g.121157  ORF Transcript_48393/g.121157 Transcript_48393/m.121157 type:complete len:471 (+) Transcript_48393:236-1648(+)